jgi:hypothetical protein
MSNAYNLWCQILLFCNSSFYNLPILLISLLSSFYTEMQPYQHVCMTPITLKQNFLKIGMNTLLKATSHPYSLFHITTNMTAEQTFKLGLTLNISDFVESKKYGGHWKFIYTLVSMQQVLHHGIRHVTFCMHTDHKQTHKFWLNIIYM